MISCGLFIALVQNELLQCPTTPSQKHLKRTMGELLFISKIACDMYMVYNIYVYQKAKALNVSYGLFSALVQSEV